MTGVIGHIENGAVHLNERVDWTEGQQVLVIALAPRPTQSDAPPTDLLEEDAREFALRAETLAEVNRRELE